MNKFLTSWSENQRTVWVKTVAWDLLALLILTAMVLWFTDDVARGGKVPFFRDLGTYFYPLRFILAQSFQAGELPLWNNHLAMGFPVAANPQSGVFYLPHLSFVILPFFSAVRFLFVSHYVIGAVGAYFLCRGWRYPIFLAMVGAVLFTFGGVVVSLISLMDHFQAAVWLPWAVYASERALQAATYPTVIALTLILSFQFLAGSPEVYCMTLGLLLLDGLRLRNEDARITIRHVFGVIFKANLLSAGLAMVQLLPALELYGQSWRSEGIAYEKMTAWSLEPLRLINLFFLDKEVNLNAFDGLHLYLSREPPLIISLYLGVAVLCGLCLWFFTSSGKEKIVVLGLLILSVSLAMGKYTLVYPVAFATLPVLPVRFPEKILFFTSALLQYAAVTGFFRFFQAQRTRDWLGLLAFAVAILGTAAIYVFLRARSVYLVELIAWARQVPIHDISTLRISSAVLVQLERQLLLLVALLSLLILWRTNKVRMAICRLLFVAMVFLDLGTAHRSYSFALDASLIDSVPKILTSAKSGEHRFFYMVQFGDFHPNAYAVLKKSFSETISFAFAGLIPNTGVFYGVDYMQELDALRRKPYDLLITNASRFTGDQLVRLLGSLNVKYVHSFQSLPERGMRLIRYFPEHSMRLYEIEDVIPRAYIVPGMTEERDPRRTLARLAKADFDPCEEVILEEGVTLSENKSSQYRSDILHYSDARVKIRTRLASPGVLVLADSFYPGWKVYVDGVENKILRANLFFRGVVLDPGNHMVEFHFQPLSLFLGAAVSTVTLLGMGSWLLLSTVRKRRIF